MHHAAMRYRIWEEALDATAKSVALAEKLQLRLDRALKRFQERTARERAGIFSLGGLTKVETQLAIEALISQAVIRFMTVFSPMGDKGDAVAANDSPAVEKRRRSLIDEVASKLGWSSEQANAIVADVRDARNKAYAHVSGARFENVLWQEVAMPPESHVVGGKAILLTYEIVPVLSMAQIKDLGLFAKVCSDILFLEDSPCM